MPTQRLKHTEGRRLEGDVSVAWGSLQEIFYNNKTVVFMQARPGGGRRPPYAVVPGYKIGEYKYVGKAISVEVETVLPADQAAVREKIQPIVEGLITFW